MVFNMLDFFNMTKSYGTDVIYSGTLWHESIEEIGTILRRKMDSDKLSLQDKNAYFSIFVEMMSNMLKYSEDKTDSGVTKGSFVSVYKKDNYYALCGNLIKNEDKDAIKNRLDSLNSMDKPSLHEFYIEKLKEKTTDARSRGAGLGLLEIARRASTPIEYEFLPYDGNLTLFTMRVSIDLTETKRAEG